MSSYPLIVDYNEVVQHPKTAFSNPLLKAGSVRTTPLGLPLALSGGFALTYEVAGNGKKYAVRCFHRQVPAAEQKYAAIAACLGKVNSPYFVQFAFESGGILIKGNRYPIVTMDWVEGPTLGLYLEANYKSKSAIANLRAQFERLYEFLNSNGIAHGDIQNGNVIIADQGIKLIDYDGMYVPGLRPGQGSETGHKHFQHPDRDVKDFGPEMDRFSFIVVDVSLRALISDPSLFVKHNEGGETIVFKANDFLDPASSEVFRALISKSDVKAYAERLASICSSDLSRVPVLRDYLAGNNIPKPRLVVRPPSTTAPIEPMGSPGYVSAYELLSSEDYIRALALVGSRVELVGQIKEVSRQVSRRGKRPYVFINFGDWRGKILKLTIWSDGLASFTTPPSKEWTGKWVSVVGLLDAPYSNTKYGYTHISITITHPNQLHFIDEKEAKYRLASKGKPAPKRNQGIVETIRAGLTGTRPGAGGTSPRGAGSMPAAQPASSNQQILAKILGQSPISRPGPQQPQTSAPSGAPAGAKPATTQSLLERIPWWLWVVGAIVAYLIIADGSQRRKADAPVSQPTQAPVPIPEVRVVPPPTPPAPTVPPVAERSPADVKRGIAKAKPDTETVAPPSVAESSPDVGGQSRDEDTRDLVAEKADTQPSPEVSRDMLAKSGERSSSSPVPTPEVVAKQISAEESASIRSACAASRYQGDSYYRQCIERQTAALQDIKRPDLSAHSEWEKQAMRNACASSQYSGPAAFYGCLHRQQSALEQYPSAPSLTRFSEEERQGMRTACASSQYSGPASYYACLHRQTAALEKTPGPGDLSHFSASERQSMHSACASSAYSGPASYNQCVRRQAAALEKTPSPPDLSAFSEGERQSMTSACASSQYSGPASYYQCLNRQVAAMRNTRMPDLSGYSQGETQSMLNACASSQYSGPASYYQCLDRQAAALRQTPAPPDLSRFSESERQRMRLDCSSSEYSGPASYYQCLWRHVR